jgi:hypothetical protein
MEAAAKANLETFPKIITCPHEVRTGIVLDAPTREGSCNLTMLI